MKRLKLFFIVVFISSSCFAKTIAPTNSPIIINEDKIIELTAMYANLLQSVFNQKSNEFLGNMINCFSNPIINRHVYDFIEKDTLYEVAFYLDKGVKTNKIKAIQISAIDVEILNCTYKDTKTEKTYAFAKLNKEIFWYSKKSSVKLTHVLAIDISTKDYIIDNVFDDNAETQKKYIAPCLNIKLDIDKEAEIAKKINTYFSKVKRYYSLKEYGKALTYTNKILELNSEFEKAISAKNAIVKLLKPEKIDTEIKEVLQLKNLNSANEKIELAELNNMTNKEQIDDWKNLVAAKKLEIQLENEFKKAEYFFDKEMYKKALVIYLNLKELNYNSSSIDNRINTCRESDPNLIKKRIEIAYNEAVASKKNYHRTFKTYHKYQNSDLLTGSNYKFMCLMMINRGNKRLVKELGFTRNQTKNLAISYFFRAKNKGENVNDIEHLVFTKNFNKKRK